MTQLFRVAIVEDNPPQRMILTRLLEKDYQVESFDSGTAFLASKASFDAVRLDIEMPGLSGYDTCRRFREQARGAEVPVIFVSARDTTPELVAAYEAGGDDFLTKPIAAHELRHKLGNAIELREKMRDFGRNFEMGSHAVINFDHVSLLVEDLPVDDPDKVGRLRDHLAVLAESADMRMAALLESIEQFGRTILTLGLTEVQVGYMDDLIRHTVDETRHYFDEVAESENDFTDVITRQQRLAQADYRL